MLKGILLACLLGLSSISSVNNVKREKIDTSNIVTTSVTKNTVRAEEPKNLYCKVTTEYIYWIDETWVNTYEFATEDDYYAWCGQDNHFTRQFHQTYVYLYQDDAKVALFPSVEFKIYAQNHSFSFTDRFGQPETSVELGYMEYSKNQITHLFVWDGIVKTTHFKVLKYCDVTFYNTKMCGNNVHLTESLFELYQGGKLGLSGGSLIYDYNLNDEVEIVNFIGDDPFEQNFSAISGDKSGGFANIKAESHSPIIMDSRNNQIDGIIFLNCTNEDDDGGAISSKVYGKILNCTFSKNHSGGDGGAIFADSQLIIENCTFNENTCDEDGGAICVNEDNTSIENCTFTSNESGTDGGAICVDGDDVKIVVCTFESNHALDDGGAIYVCTGSSDTLISGCKFKSNKADDDCDNIDDVSSTIIEGSGTVLSEGNIVAIIISFAALLLIAIGVIIYLLLKSKKGTAKKA